MFAQPEDRSLYDHQCLTAFTGFHSHPFSRRVRQVEGGIVDNGPWTVEGFTLDRSEAEDVDRVTFVLVKFCPFCGARVYPEKSAPVESESQAPEQKEAESGDEKGPSRARAIKSSNKS